MMETPRRALLPPLPHQQGIGVGEAEVGHLDRVPNERVAREAEAPLVEPDRQAQAGQQHTGGAVRAAWGLVAPIDGRSDRVH